MPSSKINLLSLDGGGVRGLSSLLILEQLMQMINPRNPPKPCEYFDMIAGTSTGGIIAIMLGRLRMSVEDCIYHYSDLMDRVFSKVHTQPMKVNWSKASLETQSRFDTRALEAAIKNVIGEVVGDSNELMLEEDPQCKVFVCAMDCQNKKPVRFPTYWRQRAMDPLSPRLLIWEAARATSAASTFFDDITLGKFRQKFRDGGTGANNPIEYLWTEALNEWPDLNEKINCVVSVGTGQPMVKGFEEENLKGLIKSLTSIATDAEQTEVKFANANGHLLDRTNRRYFRLNVTEGVGSFGLEDTEKAGTIASVTREFFEKRDEWQKAEQIRDLLKASGTHAKPNAPLVRQEAERLIVYEAKPDQLVISAPLYLTEQKEVQVSDITPFGNASAFLPTADDPKPMKSGDTRVSQFLEPESTPTLEFGPAPIPEHKDDFALNRMKLVQLLSQDLMACSEQINIMNRLLRTLSDQDQRQAQAVLLSNQLNLSRGAQSESSSTRFIQGNKSLGSHSSMSFVWLTLLKVISAHQPSIILTFACGLTSSNRGVEGPLGLARALVAQLLDLSTASLDFTANFSTPFDNLNIHHLHRLLHGLLLQCLNTEIVCLLDGLTIYDWRDSKTDAVATMRILFEAAEQRRSVGAKALRLIFTCSGPCGILDQFLKEDNKVYAATVLNNAPKLDWFTIESKVARSLK